MNRNIEIYYFSGSGNTKQLVNEMINTFTASGYNIKKFKMEDFKFNRNGNFTLGLAFSVAMQSTYPLVWDFVDRLLNGNGQEVFMLDSMESFSGGVVGPLRSVLVKKGYKCIGAREFKMSSSLNCDTSRLEHENYKNLTAIKDIRTYTKDLISGSCSWGRIPVIPDLLKAFASIRFLWTCMSKTLKVTNSCTKCGKCLRNCPVGAISFIEKKVEIDHQKCISCFRCANNCPFSSILYNNKKLVSPASVSGGRKIV